MKIYKYTLNITDVQTIKLPYVWQILSIQKQFDSFVMWVLVNPDMHETEMTIEIYGTGDTVHQKENKIHISTV